MGLKATLIDCTGIARSNLSFWRVTFMDAVLGGGMAVFIPAYKEVRMKFSIV